MRRQLLGGRGCDPSARRASDAVGGGLEGVTGARGRVITYSTYRRTCVPGMRPGRAEGSAAPVIQRWARRAERDRGQSSKGWAAIRLWLEWVLAWSPRDWRHFPHTPINMVGQL